MKACNFEQKFLSKFVSCLKLRVKDLEVQLYFFISQPQGASRLTHPFLKINLIQSTEATSKAITLQDMKLISESWHFF